MFRCKKDVDRHVQGIFRKLKNDEEKDLRCYNIAKLYYQVGEYESAKRYVCSYLGVREGSAGAHKLLGQALEALGQKEGALAQYKISLELEGRQNDLVLKVCELLADTDIDIDVNGTRYWIERADKLFPHHPIVFQLKEKMLSIDRPNNNSEDLEGLIASELSARPKDIHLRVKLLKHYMTKNKFEDAYNHALSVEATYSHRSSIVWYQALCELLPKCKESKQSDVSFWIMYVSALERYAALCLNEQGGEVLITVPEAAQAVFNFDQGLNELKLKNFSSNSALIENLLLHMCGQLHFHLACLFLRKTKREQGSWTEAGRLCAPLFLSALHVVPIDPTVPWAAKLKDDVKDQIRLWYKEGSYRCSQAGHVLQDFAKDDVKKLMDRIDKFCIGPWRNRIYQRIFTSKNHQKHMGTSYFCNHVASNLVLRLCSYMELKRYDEISEEVWPDSLHHQVWLGLKSHPHSKDKGPHPHQYSHVFSELQFSVYNLNQAAPDSLNRLDIDAFLNAAILCTSVVFEEQQFSGFLNPERLPTLPADLTNTLCSCTQAKWWSCAYKMYSKQELPDRDVAEIRQELQRGLEVIRCIGNHGLHPAILIHLGRIFHHRVKLLKEKDKAHSDIPALEAHSELYWTNAVSLLERLQNNQNIRMTNCKLFNYQGKDLNNAEITNALEEGKLLLAQRFLRDRQYEQAIDALQALKCPEASFQQAQIYKALADEKLSSQPRESLTSELRSQHIIMLSKARNCFYLTLDRLRSPGTDPKHPLNAELCTHISDIENELKRIDPDLWRSDLNRNECDGMSDESYSSAHSGVDQPVTVTNMTSSVNVLSTPQRHSHRTPKQASTPCRPQNLDVLDLSRNRAEVRPSPERLDAQIRQLIHSRDNLMQIIMEQNKVMMETNKTLMEKIDQLTKDMAELRKDTQKQFSQRVASGRPTGEEEEAYPHGAEELNDANYGANQTSARSTSFNSISGNMLFPPPHRHPHSSFLYPPSSLHGYYPGAMPFTEPNPAILPQLLPYPIPLYFPEGPKITENVDQQAVFAPKLPCQLSDLINQPITMPPLQMMPQKVVDAGRPETSIKDAPVNKTPPVNVVITTSDTLPTTAPQSQAMLSVTIPPQHRLNSVPSTSIAESINAPHSYQIPMPSEATIPTTVNLPPLSATLTTTPASISLIETSQSNKTNILSTTSANTSAELGEVEHDPIPDFVPVIPLPAEVKVTTGEEGETVLYCARAKLFRFADKEWKERGVGDVKLLQNTEGKVRLLMRRDQVLKICANHMLRPDMELTPMPNNDRAWIWVANDFADETVKLEKLCIKFKTADEARSFKKSFDKAKLSFSSSSAESSLEIIDKSSSSQETPRTPSTPIATGETATRLDVQRQTNEATTPETISFGQQAATPVVVGGFCFSSKPIIQKDSSEASKATQKPEEQPKVNPFVGFTFSKSPESGVTITPVGNASTSSSLPQQLNTFTFAKTSVAATTTQSTNIFNPSTSVESSTNGNANARPGLRRPHAPAPSSTTGNETILFEQKATLQYYAKEQKQWRDAGSGVLRIVQDVKTEKIRLILYKPDTSKIICDHDVTPEMKLSFKSGSNTSVTCYYNIQESTKDSRSETFAATFDTPEQAFQFHNTILCYQQMLIKDRTSADNVKSKSTTESAQKPLSEMFKPPAGSWECKDCYTRNDASKTSCVACNATHATPGASKPPVTSSTNQIPLSQMFKSPAGSWKCNGCYIINTSTSNYCVACDAPKDPSMPPKPKQNSFNLGTTATGPTPTFTFGIPKTTSKDSGSGFNFTISKPEDKGTNNAVTSTTSLIFGTSTKPKESTAGFVFELPQQPSTPPNKEASSTFGSPGKGFDFQLKSKTPVKSPGGADNSEEEVAESEDVYFAPVIPLPDKVDVKTGEEDEDILYSHRAKLFRFDPASKEWKERGLGDIKLLRHKRTNKLRLIMRRDQVLKLCLNHLVPSDLELKRKDEKTLLWNGADYSEGEIEYMQFACRFKTSDIAEDFKKAVENALKSSKDSTRGSKSESSSTTTESPQDIQVVYELKVTPAEKEAALKLKLPENFYAYKQKEDCPGCLGCKEPGLQLFGTEQSQKSGSTPKSQTPVESKQTIFGSQVSAAASPVKSFEPSSGDPSLSSKKTTSESTNIFSTLPSTTTISGFGALKSSTPMKSNSVTTPMTFGGATFGENKPSPIGFVFGGTVNQNSPSTLSAPSVFDQPTAPATTASEVRFLENLKICGPFSTNSSTQQTTSDKKDSGISTVFGSSSASKNGRTSGIISSPKLVVGGSTDANTSTTNSASNASSANLFNAESSTLVGSNATPNVEQSVAKTTSLVFGNITGTTSIFGNAGNRTNANATPSFGALPKLNDNESATAPATGVFGSKFAFGATAFGNTAPMPNIFDGKTSDNTAKSETEVSFLPTNNFTTFSTLAAAANQQVAFKTDPNFSFADAGSCVFGSKSSASRANSSVDTSKAQKSSSVKKEDGDEDNDEENDNDQEHDPFFEPVVPLPDMIEIRTGEEEEEKVFCHRAKLYRYDNATKEWKERGVGEMKLLYHAGHGTYRLLLRRDFVHKVSCNFLLTPDIQFHTLMSSDRSWMWAGVNYAEEPTVEQLAVKFKSPESANQFKEAVDKAQNDLREKQNSQGEKHTGKIGLFDKYCSQDGIDDDEFVTVVRCCDVPVGSHYGEDNADEDKEIDKQDDKDDDEDEDEDDDDESSVTFEKRASLYAKTNANEKWTLVALGNLAIYYDSGLFGERIILKADENGKVVTDTVISMDTVMQVEGKECIWTGTDYALKPPQRRTLKAVFSSSQAAQEMFQNYEDGLECAKQAGISDPDYDSTAPSED